MKKFWQQFGINTAWWLVVLIVWMAVVHTDMADVHEQIEHFLPSRFVIMTLIALAMAFLNTVMDWWMDRRDALHKISFRKKMILIVLRQLIFIGLVGVVIYTIMMNTMDKPPTSDLRTFFQRFNLGSFWIYTGFAAYTLEMIKAVDKKLGPGNLWKMMIGQFSKPKELERIFMFLDLRGATSLAETLGNIRYSELLQDCFHDISVVRRFGAEVFQYVGDEVVLVWSTDKGLDSFNCIEAYFGFMNRINEKSSYYLERYGTVPFFKAGIHKGTVVLAEVGEIKRAIAYHGDTINTAARIQDKCNEFNQSIMLSETLLSELNNPAFKEKYSIEKLGSVSLKGKDKTVNVAGLQRAVD